MLRFRLFHSLHNEELDILSRNVLRADFDPGENIYTVRRKVLEQFHFNGSDIDKAPTKKLTDPRISKVEVEGRNQKSDRLFLVLRGRVIRQLDLVIDN